MRFFSWISLVTLCGLAVPGAFALPLESDPAGPKSAVSVQSTLVAQASTPPQAQNPPQNTPAPDNPGEVNVNPKLPEGTQQQPSATPEQTAPAPAPPPPPVIGGAENPPLPKVYKPADPIRHISSMGSTYIPMDSWMYPALDRLSSLGYIDTAFFTLRPWTRLSVAHMLEQTEPKLDENPQDVTAREIFSALMNELLPDLRAAQVNAQLDTVYGNYTQIGGEPLTDSFHFGQSIINNYGRPYAEGFNLQLGGSAKAQAGRFTAYFRGEYQHAPSLPVYPASVQDAIAKADGGIILPPDYPSTGVRNDFRVQNAYGSYHIWGMETSIGKSDMWWGPGQGGAMAYSNNAEAIYTIRINRVEPLYIPWFSRIFGPIRFDNFFGGPLQGHNNPPSPWLLGDKISLHPTKDIEFGFSRTVEFAGQGYMPLTFGTFWKSFSCICDSYNAGGREYDVGDRRGSFDFRWRLPGLRKTLTIYADSNADDDPSPLANFRRSGWRPGFYLSHIPGAPRFDLRFEAPYTNQSHQTGINYTNHAYKDGYTNNSFLIGDWIGRDSTGYQGWLTYWLSPKETVQGQYRDVKLDTALWPGGGTQTDFSVKLVKRLSRNVELNTSVQYERWWIPLLNPTKQSDVIGNFQIIWYPKIGTSR